MDKKEHGICRICNEYDEKSGSLEFVYSFSNIIIDIRETLGIEILVDTDTPNYVCHECISSLENAQKFRQKCIRSNEYYASMSVACKEYESSSPKEAKLFDSNFQEGGSTPPTTFNSAINTVELKTNESSDEKANITVEDHIVQEHSDKVVSLEKSSKSTNGQDNTSDSITKKSVRKRNKFEVGRKQRTKDKSAAPVICDICGNVFKAKHVFALHLRRHSNNKPYDCELCSSRFYTNSELKRHMRRHTGEKPYECQYCHRKFSDYGTLTKHIRTHTNDRPFPCMQCGKSFSCTFVLKNHMLIHTGERAFRCEVCDKSFGRLHNLTTHMKSIYHQRNICKKENKTEVS